MFRALASPWRHSLTRVGILVACFAPAFLATCAEAFGSEVPARQSALERLRAVAPDRLPIVISVGARQQAAYWLRPCSNDVLFLSGLEVDVNKDLENLTTTTNEVHVRYRAMMSLVMRGSENGIRIAADWTRSASAGERFAGWNSLQYCPRTLDVVCGVLPVNTMLDRYRDESDPDVRNGIESFFGTHKACFAVDALCHTLTDPEHRPSGSIADVALAEIGDPRAVAALTRSRTSPATIVWALGRLADQRGADYVIDHLYLPGAPVALARIGGAKALPALHSARESLQRGEVPKGVRAPEYYLKNQTDEVHLAIVLRTSKDPQTALLDIAENAKNSVRYRSLALEELGRLGIARVRPQFLTFYRSVMPTVLGTSCIPVLESDPCDQVTAAMKSHLLVLDSLPRRRSPECDDSVVVGADLTFAQSALLFALHKRIGNEVFTIRQQEGSQQSSSDVNESPK